MESGIKIVSAYFSTEPSCELAASSLRTHWQVAVLLLLFLNKTQIVIINRLAYAVCLDVR